MSLPPEQPKPQADIFAKVDDPRMEEYRLA